MKKEQIKCPNCGGFKTITNSPKGLLLGIGTIFILVGMLLAFFLIGIPLAIIGIVMVAIGYFLKETGQMKCKNCNFEFIRTSNIK